MDSKFFLTITDKETDETSKIEVTLENDEIELLQKFHQEVEELKQTKIAQSGVFFHSFNFDYQAGNGIETKGELPPAIEIKELLHSLRPFLLKNEPTYFNYVKNKISKNCDSNKIRTHLKDLKKKFNSVEVQNNFKFETEKLVINSEEALNYWLNGFEYHRDEEKRKNIKKVEKWIDFNSLKVIFMILMEKKVEAILKLNNLIELLLDKKSKIDT